MVVSTACNCMACYLKENEVYFSDPGPNPFAVSRRKGTYISEPEEIYGSELVSPPLTLAILNPFPRPFRLPVFRKPFPLPMELLRRIIAFSDNVHCSPTWDKTMDLHRLLYVSRAWRFEAEKYLYTYVNVPAGNILLFCRTIMERHDLARRVRELLIFGHGRVIDLDNNVFLSRKEGDTELVSRTLESFINLKDLTMWGSIPTEGYEPIFGKWDTWILRNCTFRLYRFRSNFFWTPGLSDFLVLQPEIRILEVTGPYGDIPPKEVPAGALPKLRCIKTYAGVLKDFKELPPITHAHLGSFGHTPEEESRGLDEICRLGSTLKVFMFGRQGDVPGIDSLGPASVLLRVAKKGTKPTRSGDL